MEKKNVRLPLRAHLACGLQSVTYSTQSSGELSSLEHYNGLSRSIPAQPPSS